ncbi:MAG: hypothetical protein A2Y90_06790 [Chloroflexi bacterium RBG_13_52_12]|nr:MAG: hypothetical protein A2Y90_06790 [Chloroflexi bacterium RBG_13_52_12]
MRHKFKNQMQIKPFLPCLAKQSKTLYNQKTVQKISRSHFTVNISRDTTPVIDKIVREANR